MIDLADARALARDGWTVKDSEMSCVIVELCDEVERLQKWADSFSDAQLKERATGEAYQAELRQRAERAEATRCDPPRKPLAEGREHLTADGQFQSDLFLCLPPGFVPVKVSLRNLKGLRRVAEGYRNKPGKEEFFRDLTEALDNLGWKQ